MNEDVYTMRTGIPAREDGLRWCHLPALQTLVLSDRPINNIPQAVRDAGHRAIMDYLTDHPQSPHRVNLEAISTFIGAILLTRMTVRGVGRVLLR